MKPKDDFYNESNKKHVKQIPPASSSHILDRLIRIAMMVIITVLSYEGYKIKYKSKIATTKRSVANDAKVNHNKKILSFAVIRC